jgi:hypothetical protein
VGPCYHGMARPRVAGGGDGLQIWRVAANILKKQSQTADRGLITLRCKEATYYEMLHGTSELAACFEHGNELSGSMKGGKSVHYDFYFWQRSHRIS